MLTPGINTSAPGGALYSGDTPTVFAAPTAQGTGSGTSEANATTFADALAHIVAGECLGVAPGLSSGAVNSERWEPIFAPTNSGTLANPIRIRAKYPAVYNRSSPALLSEIRISNPQALGGNSAVLGVRPGTNHVHFSGFYVNQGDSPPRPSNGNFLIAYSTTGIWFEDCWLVQVITSQLDNYDSFYCEGATNLVIRNNHVQGGYGTGNHNASTMTLYGCTNILVEFNTFSAVNNGIFVKGSHNGAYNSGTVRYNKSTGAYQSLLEIAEVSVGSPVLAYQNLSIRDGQGIVFDDSGKGCSDSQAYSNTIVSPVRDAMRADGGALTSMACRDNLIAFLTATSSSAVNYQSRSTSGTSPLDYNHYFRSNGNSLFGQNGQSYSSLGAWRTATSKEASSTEGNPLFTNSANDDYTLQVGSPARTGSSTGGARGCYITGNEIIGAAA
jgi:hypothetical protein